MTRMKRTGRLGTQVWTDRPGEHWPTMSVAARAIGAPSRTSIVKAVASGRPYAGRLWFMVPPAWATPAVRDLRAERARREAERAASIRCHPGPTGYVVNGTDVRTGTVYVGGKAVSGKAPAAA